MTRMNWGHVRLQAAMRRYGSDTIAKTAPDTDVRRKPKPTKGKVWIVCMRCRATANVKPQPGVYRCAKCNGVARVKRHT